MHAAKQLEILEQKANELSLAITKIREEIEGMVGGGVPISMPLSPPRYLRLKAFSQYTGYTDKAVRVKLDKGQWLEGRHYRKAPDGHIMMDLEAYYRWVEGHPL